MALGFWTDLPNRGVSAEAVAAVLPASVAADTGLVVEAFAPVEGPNFDGTPDEPLTDLLVAGRSWHRLAYDGVFAGGWERTDHLAHPTSSEGPRWRDVARDLGMPAECRRIAMVDPKGERYYVDDEGTLGLLVPDDAEAIRRTLADEVAGCNHGALSAAEACPACGWARPAPYSEGDRQTASMTDDTSGNGSELTVESDEDLKRAVRNSGDPILDVLGALTDVHTDYAKRGMSVTVGGTLPMRASVGPDGVDLDALFNDKDEVASVTCSVTPEDDAHDVEAVFHPENARRAQALLLAAGDGQAANDVVDDEPTNAATVLSDLLNEFEDELFYGGSDYAVRTETATDPPSTEGTPADGVDAARFLATDYDAFASARVDGEPAGRITDMTLSVEHDLDLDTDAWEQAVRRMAERHEHQLCRCSPPLPDDEE